MTNWYAKEKYNLPSYMIQIEDTKKAGTSCSVTKVHFFLPINECVCVCV